MAKTPSKPSGKDAQEAGPKRPPKPGEKVHPKDTVFTEIPSPKED